jgi:hypothetical protein
MLRQPASLAAPAENAAYITRASALDPETADDITHHQWDIKRGGGNDKG